MNSTIERSADTRTAPAVTIWDPRSPIRRPKNPAMNAASSGRKIAATSMIAASALHHIDVVHRDGAAVTEVDDENGKTDGGLGGGDGQDEHREHLTDQVIEEHGERHQIDVHRQQDQLDGHQDDDDVLPVQEYSEDAEREHDRRNGEVMGETDFHSDTSPGRHLADRDHF